jgi:hypothetical protein
MRKVLVLFLLVSSVSCASRNHQQTFYPNPMMGPQLDEMSLKKSFGDRVR